MVVEVYVEVVDVVEDGVIFVGVEFGVDVEVVCGVFLV